jgi:hypothetical protein
MTNNCPCGSMSFPIGMKYSTSGSSIKLFDTSKNIE